MEKQPSESVKKLITELESYLDGCPIPSKMDKPEKKTYNALRKFTKSGKGDISEIVRGQLEMIHGVDFDYESEGDTDDYKGEHDLQAALVEYEKTITRHKPRMEVAHSLSSNSLVFQLLKVDDIEYIVAANKTAIAIIEHHKETQ